jgi:hypothetical protein
MTTPTSTETILQERGNRYGTFAGNAATSQALKRLMAEHLAKHNKALTDDQWEAMEMIAHKLARIINGDPDYHDNWADIAGYAKLVADRLETGKEA